MSRILATGIALGLVALTSQPSDARFRIRMSSAKASPAPVAMTPKPVPAAQQTRTGGFVVMPVPRVAASQRQDDRGPQSQPMNAYSGPAQFVAEPTTGMAMALAEPQASAAMETPKAPPPAGPFPTMVLTSNIPARTMAPAASAGRTVVCVVQAAGGCKPL